MKVLVDTCVWSLVLRGKDPRNEVVKKELELLIDENRVLIIGPIRQEILSAYKDEKMFKRINKHLFYFPSSIIEENDYVVAAKYHCLCRSKGVQGSHIDFLICAVATRLKATIFTLDKDFLNFNKYLPLTLYKPKDFNN